MKKRYIVIGAVAAVATLLYAIGFILADEGSYDEDYPEHE